MKNRPAYSIESVDHALRLVTLLQQEGPLRVADAAKRLGVAPSTAHRLLAMLVYRDFAKQDDSRRYVAGPVMLQPALPEPVGDLRRIGLPYLQALMAQVEETTNLLVVVGNQARFVSTVECSQVLRVGDREGMVVPAHLASGGLAGLAQLPEEQVTHLYSQPGSPVEDAAALLRKLCLIRRQGFAVNNQATEAGVTALGVPLRTQAGNFPAALSIAMPTVRFRHDRIPVWVERMRQCAARIECALSLEVSMAGSTGQPLNMRPALT
jgi:DNA-binding IclR family transcriptional regulator